MGRKKARDNAFKCVYQLSFGQDIEIEKIDNVILNNLKNWTIDRIFKIDLAILRLAIYEILYIDNIPEKVSANEAVELAKTYGNNDSKSFVNGLIAKVIKGKVEN